MTQLGSLSRTRITLPYFTVSKQTRPFAFSKLSPRLTSQKSNDTFVQFVNRVNPRFQWYTHCETLSSVLQRVVNGDLRRVMVFMPPRHGKTELVSRLFSSYYLHRYPDRWVGINSYAAELAYTLSRNSRANYREAGGGVSEESYAVKHWETDSGGGMWAAGVGGSITGKGGNLLLIDDPIKNAVDAQSFTVREKQKDWYRSTFSTRLEPNGAIVIVQTRWNEDDLSGWLLSDEMEGDEPENWHIVNFEAIREGDSKFPPTCTVEKDWRQSGEALCPERYGIEELNHLKSRNGSYFFSALYQQRPTAREGNFFKRSWFEIVEESPQDARRVRWWDMASSPEPTADQTVGLRMAESGGIYYIEDVVCGRWSSKDRNDIVLQSAKMDGPSVHQWMEQEPGSSGKDVAQAFVSMMAGYPAYTEPSTGSKEVRADPFAAQAQAGNVKLVAGAWNKHFIDELTSFPSGKHDDQVDSASGAFNKLARSSGSLLLFS